MPSLARLLPAARCNVLAMLHVPALPGTFLIFFLNCNLFNVLTLQGTFLICFKLYFSNVPALPGTFFICLNCYFVF